MPQSTTATRIATVAALILVAEWTDMLGNTRGVAKNVEGTRLYGFLIMDGHRQVSIAPARYHSVKGAVRAARQLKVPAAQANAGRQALPAAA